MKKEYERPELEVIKIDNEVIVTSGGEDIGDKPEW